MRRISLAGVSFRGGAVLLGQRRPGTSIGVRWEFPGGKLESDESPEDGLKREFQEELGVRILPLSHFFSGEFTNKGKEYLLKAYWVKLLSADFSTMIKVKRFFSPDPLFLSSGQTAGLFYCKGLYSPP